MAAAVTLSDLAAQLAAENQADRDEAVLGGLLYYADDWLGEASRRVYPGGWAAPGNRGDKPRRSLPAVAQAVEVLAGGATDAAAEAAHRRGAAAAGRWAAQLGGPTDWLPSLAARLARLAALEDRFRRDLEQEKLAALAEFAAGAGHEINNPLTVIAGRAQLFLREETDPERRRGLALINAQAMRVYEMIADLRLFARPPAARVAAPGPGRAGRRADCRSLARGGPAGDRWSCAAATAGRWWSRPTRRNWPWPCGRCATTRWRRSAGQGHVDDRAAAAERAAWRFASATTAPASRPRSAGISSIPSIRRGRPGRGLGLGAVEVLADRHQSWRPHRGGEQPGDGDRILITMPAVIAGRGVNVSRRVIRRLGGAARNHGTYADPWDL